MMDSEEATLKQQLPIIERMFPILRMIYGALFMASATLKLFPLDYFELILVHQVGLSWEWVPWFSRAILIFEFGLGAMIAAGFQLRTTVWTSLGLLAAFQVFLLLQIARGEGDADCGCFGELIPLDGPSSVIKNVGFMLLAGVLLLKLEWAKRWSIAWAGPLLLVLAIPALFLIEPLPEYNEDADFQLDLELLTRTPFQSASGLHEGNKTVVMMLSSCVHCAQLSSFIATLEPEQVEDELRIIIVGNEGGVNFFVEETGIEEFVYVRSKDRELIGAIDGTFPTVLYLENGEVSKKWKGKDVNIRLLNELLAID